MPRGVTLVVMASNLIANYIRPFFIPFLFALFLMAMASNLIAMASTLVAVASNR